MLAAVAGGGYGLYEAIRVHFNKLEVSDDPEFDPRPELLVASLSAFGDVWDSVAFELPAGGPGWLVTNPPYGVRVGRPRPLRDLYAALGRVASSVAVGGRLVMLSADPSLEGQLGIPMDEVLQTRNGGIAVRVVAGRPGMRE